MSAIRADGRFTPNRFCPQGHDKDVVGRDGTGSCRQCRRAGAVRYRRSRNIDPRLSVEPLRLALKDALRSTPVNEFIRCYVGRWPASHPSTVERQLYRLLSQSRTVRLHEADRWCVVLGRNIHELWPELMAS